MQELLQKKRKLIEFLAEKNILVGPDLLEKLNSTDNTEEISALINQQLTPKINDPEIEEGTVKVVFSYNTAPRKTTAQDFITYFNARYTSLKKILQQRSQLENALSIGKLRLKQERDVVSSIGMVMSREETKSGLMITLEDPTGTIKVYFGKSKPELMSKANDIVLDEVIGVSGSMGKNIIFAKDVFFPDIPITKEIKKSPKEEYALFSSDIHVGSKKFMEEEFLKMIKWLNGELGNEKQKEISSKVKYLFITGDAIDGISVYPNQRDDLNITTYRDQYKKLAEYLKMIPRHIKIIICPGQHDIVALAEPQYPLPAEYCSEILELPNVIAVSNPAIVNIASRNGFPGLDVLMYHGDSYNYYADVVESIRAQRPNISDRAEFVMKLLLQKRHLAPTYDGSPHVPADVDHLVIEKIPDVFISGDVHKSAVFTYKGVITGIISSCFQARTAFQDKVGHIPDPGRIPVMNLKTREVKMLNFSSGAESQ